MAARALAAAITVRTAEAAMAAAVVATEAVVVAALVVAVAMALHVRAYLYLVLNMLQVPFQCKKSLICNFGSGGGYGAPC